MSITDEGALLVLVNRHNNKYNGTICAKANSYKCGAQEYFRKNYCARNIPDCSDLKLFCEEREAYLFKCVKQHERKPFEDLVSLIKAGKNPIVFFYTAQSKGNLKSYCVVGLYVVREVKCFAIEYDKYEYQIYPEKFIRLPLDVLSNEGLWNDSLPDSTYYWLRHVYKSAVAPVIEDIAQILRRTDRNEYGRFIDSADSISSQLAGISKISEDKGPKSIASSHSPNGEHKQKSAGSSAKNVSSTIKKQFDVSVAKLKSLAAEEGFYYSEKTIRNIVSSLMVNPLLILSGISGGGKSSFAKFYASAVEGKFLVVSVRPDWTSPAHFLGVYNPFIKDFVPTRVTAFIQEAGSEWQKAKSEKREPKPFVLLLDEMNLARVEYYFSDFLSKMQVPQEEFRTLDLYCESDGKYPHKILIPENLKIIGTVNIDETTYLFSPKVLDRSTYISLDDIDLEGMGAVIDKRGSLHHLELIRNYVMPELRDLNVKLAEFEQPFGYRTVWDILRWIDYSLTVGNICDVHEGLDAQIETKILVKLSETRKVSVLTSLKSYFDDRNEIFQISINKNVYDRCLRRLDKLISRTSRDEYAIGQQY